MTVTCDTTPKIIEVDGNEFGIEPQFRYLSDMCGERGGVGVLMLSQLELELLGKLFTTISPSLLTEVLVTLVEEMCSPHVSVVFFSMEVKLGLCPRKTYWDSREATML